MPEAKLTSSQAFPRVVNVNVMKKSNIIWARKTPVNDAPIRFGKHIHSIEMTNVEIFGNL